MEILFAASEVYPLIKTGGLADVAGYLPIALDSKQANISLAVPAYRQILAALPNLEQVSSINIDDHEISVLQTVLPNTSLKLLLIGCADLFEREGGGPYVDSNGHDWPDNGLRFGLFCKACVQIATDNAGLQWRPDIVHCNDWQTGLIPALLRQVQNPPHSIFTIHNLAYQGVFPHETFTALSLPEHLWSYDALEFFDNMSFIKGGIAFADKVTTVSPQYAEEIKTEEFGHGLHDLLAYRADDLYGILNGIDTQTWNPGSDATLPAPFTPKKLSGKALSKAALQNLFGLPESANTALIGIVTRFTWQKGIDLLIEALPQLLDLPLQLVILGTGDKDIEDSLQYYAEQSPDKLALKVTYNEDWAHLLIAGSDMFLMPSRFEPCGLTQLYSLRYGTVPIVRAIGGLVNTVNDCTAETLADDTATGFHFTQASSNALANTIIRALEHYPKKRLWKQLQRNGMRQDFSWQQSAAAYIQLYQQVLQR